ncbi:hypothetical protein JZO73_06305 [Enterococcus plantarum]|uniref:SpaA isopeptide-forming pilin-related protein n=1 Tax=Enterococcus plantarum TaxID=1077675 RepID=UPI001A904DC0|nr:SpaA isopeptide-forming pilin-related protein [Enterococcus plantarum]MBO0467143.1 hypothetical protein [Enterococcus plantarum]
MKQKIRYLLFSFVLVLLALGAFGGKQAEAVQNTSSWSTGASANNQLGTTLANNQLQNPLVTPKSATQRYFAPPSCGGVQVIKYDERTNARLSGAQFTIYDRWGRALQDIQSNYNGIAETRSLPIGYYTIRESRAPNGYQLEPSMQSFTILRGGQLVCITKSNRPIQNPVGGLKVIKVGENNQVLPGATFDIYNGNNQYLGRITTGANGVAGLGNLPFGTYKLIEVQAPNGYELDTTPKYVTISPSLPGGVASITISNKKIVSKSSIKIIKTGENNQALAGAVFDIYNSNNQYMGRVATGANGEVSVGNLAFGTYKLIEVQAPNGYELDATPKYVTISASSPGGVASITIPNRKIVKKGSIKIIKTGENNQTLAGAIFDIYNPDNQYMGRVPTGANGEVSLGNLAFGTYKLIEVQAPNGYELDATPKYVTLSASSPGGVASITISNKKIVSTGTLEVIKKDESGKLLAGAEFEVRDENDKVIGNITTDVNGVGQLKDLPFGTYTLIETKAPAGYELDETPKTITVAKDDPNGVVSVIVENKKETTTGNLEVVKKDEEGTLLEGAEFEVYNDKDELVGTITTDANGVGQLNDLPYGDYNLIETKAPEGYELDTTPKTITIAKNNPDGTLSVEVINKKEKLPETGILKIIKYVKDSDPIVYLQGAVFEVYDNDTQLVSTQTTDANGEILLNDLEPGKYYVIEVEAPPGYEENSVFYEVIVESGKITEVRHANEKMENLGGLKITKFAIDDDGFETDIVLPNAEFEVTDSAGNVHKGTTDAQGELFFPDLPVGEVSITETKAPDGYEIDTATQTKSIITGEIAEAIFYNKPKVILGRALVYVSSNNTRTVLNGLEYNIRCTKGSAYETTVLTNKFGQISTYLPPGEYEIEPVIKGYSNASKAKSFKIEASKFTIVRLTI